MRYIVDFYDMCDGWIRAGIEPEKEVCFDDLQEARRYRDKKNEELPDSNKRAGEHYGIIDTKINREVEHPIFAFGSKKVEQIKITLDKPYTVPKGKILFIGGEKMYEGDRFDIEFICSPTEGVGLRISGISGIYIT